MRFSQLLAAADVAHVFSGDDVEVTCVTDDSRRCAGGACFIAVRGCSGDGHDFIPQALAAGASAVVCEDSSSVQGVACAVVNNTRKAAGPVAQALAGWPARKLTAIGVTGTNGKTTVAALTAEILQADGHSCGVIGTIAHSTPTRRKAASNTTPGPIELAELTAEMVAGGADCFVMEASSHALDQDRTAGMSFDAAVFTNLSGEHLDYHGDMDAYAAAKYKLFESLKPRGCAVINRDDPRGDQMASAAKGRDVLWYGMGDDADLRGEVVRMDAAGTRMLMHVGGRSTEIVTPLIGLHNVYNCLAATGVAISLGAGMQTVAAALGEVAFVPGRLQRVTGGDDVSVFVDYAHTDDALANVLKAVREICPGRIILVFGCGGDRDRTKRPRMAQAAEAGADVIIVTSDNPRNEEPGSIIDEIMTGFSDATAAKVKTSVDRKKAIYAAVAMAGENDVVLIAGKGHENYQIIGSARNHFDDVEVAAAAIGHRRAGA